VIYPVVVHPGLTLLLYALAVARVTYLITDDRILCGPREAVKAWAFRRAAAKMAPGEQMDEAHEDCDIPYLYYLVTCPWCVSIWMALPAAIIWWNWPTEWWTLGPAILLAFSYVTGKLAQIGD
jgi:hypothetical protein